MPVLGRQAGGSYSLRMVVDRPGDVTGPSVADSSWEVVDPGELDDRLRRELAAEAGPGHLLHRADAAALTRCTRCGSVGFHLRNARFAIVELTGSGTEEAPPRPVFRQFTSFDAFRETLNRHHHP